MGSLMRPVRSGITFKRARPVIPAERLSARRHRVSVATVGERQLIKCARSLAIRTGQLRTSRMRFTRQRKICQSQVSSETRMLKFVEAVAKFIRTSRVVISVILLEKYMTDRFRQHR